MKKATIYDYARMCKSQEDCTKCPIAKNISTCHLLIEKHPEKSNEIILNWCEEHPIKTRQSEIQKTIPNLTLTDGGCCDACPACIDDDFCTKKVCDNYNDCDKCKEDYWLAEVEKNDK